MLSPTNYIALVGQGIHTRILGLITPPGRWTTPLMYPYFAALTDSYRPSYEVFTQSVEDPRPCARSGRSTRGFFDTPVDSVNIVAEFSDDAPYLEVHRVFIESVVMWVHKAWGRRLCVDIRRKAKE